MSRILPVIALVTLTACTAPSPVTPPKSSPAPLPSPTPTTARPTPSPAQSATADQYQLSLNLPANLFEAGSDLNVEVLSAGDISQNERNAAFQRDCGYALSQPDGSIPDVNFPATLQACKARQATEINAVTPQRISLKAGQTNYQLPLTGIAEGERFTVSLTAQPQGTCFGVSKLQTLTRTGAIQPLAGFDTREGWSYLDIAGKAADAKATACLHGQVTDTNGAPVAGALVVPTWTQSGYNASQPPAITDASGRYRLQLDSQDFDLGENFELMLGKPGLSPVTIQGAARKNAGWLPNLNRHDAKLTASPATSSLAINLVTPEARKQFDLDYPLTVSVTSFPADSFGPGVSAETRWQRRKLVYSKELSWAEYAGAPNLPLAGVQPGDYLEVSLQGHAPQDACAQTGYRRRMLATSEMTLNTSGWLGSSSDQGCLHKFPLSLSVVDGDNKPLDQVQVDLEYPGLFPSDAPVRQTVLTQLGKVSIPVSLGLASISSPKQTVTLRLNKSGYRSQTVIHTVIKPEGRPDANQLSVKLEKELP